MQRSAARIAMRSRRKRPAASPRPRSMTRSALRPGGLFTPSLAMRRTRPAAAGLDDAGRHRWRWPLRWCWRLVWRSRCMTPGRPKFVQESRPCHRSRPVPAWLRRAPHRQRPSLLRYRRRRPPRSTRQPTPAPMRSARVAGRRRALQPRPRRHRASRQQRLRPPRLRAQQRRHPPPLARHRLPVKSGATPAHARRNETLKCCGRNAPNARNVWQTPSRTRHLQRRPHPLRRLRHPLRRPRPLCRPRRYPPRPLHRLPLRRRHQP